MCELGKTSADCGADLVEVPVDTAASDPGVAVHATGKIPVIAQS